ncbi:MAG TPA: RNA methyltransferase [Polyangiaceae bacterium]|nr:RNA methyltransferase [Polyangiaceae bacterium]
MRRRSPGVRRANELFGADVPAELGVDPQFAIETLEPLVTEQRRARLCEVIARRVDAVTVLMDAPHDPHNGGAVVRSCDAFGVQHLHVIERYEPFVVATTVAKGSEKWIDVHLHATADDGAAALVRRGHQFVATDPDGDLMPEDLRAIPRLALVIGNERDGIASDLRRLCPRAVRVPMRGFVDSLNLSVSTAVLLAAAVAGRDGDLSDAERQRLYARGLFLTVPRAAEVLFKKRSAEA